MASPPKGKRCVIMLYNGSYDIFGHENYKGKQEQIVEAAVLGADVLVVAPTGMGKSVCFQVPAIVAKHGVTLVVSPLLEVAILQSKQLPVYALSSQTSDGEKQQIMEDLKSGNPGCRLLYVTPERIVKDNFKWILNHLHSRGQINRLVIDEAHCISEWGHDFRASYRGLDFFREKYKEVPIMALTATATLFVQEDIIRSLKMSREHLFRALHPFNRSNLYYEIRYLSTMDSEEQMANIYQYISTLHNRRGSPSSGVVYCRAKATCNQLAGYLKDKGLNARPYHADLEPAVLDQTLKEWTRGGTGEGGIDLSLPMLDLYDHRYIIHYDLPKSLEGYYQETGRAGRDGLPSKCVLYYSREDAHRLSQLISKTHERRTAAAGNGPPPSQRTTNSLTALISFAENVGVCRHISICRYFGEKISTTDAEVVKGYCDKMCDVCAYPDKTKRKKAGLSSVSPAEADFFRQIGNSSRYPGYDEEPSPSERYCGPSRHMNPYTPELKRPYDGGANGSAKKPKVNLAPMMVTRAFNSASSLKKPFKTPFKSTPPSSSPATSPPNIAGPSTSKKNDSSYSSSPPVEMGPPQPPHMSEFEEEDEDLPERIMDGYVPESKFSSLIDFEVKLEASMSAKVKLELREAAFQEICHSLAKHLIDDPLKEEMWASLKASSLSLDSRTEIVLDSVQEIEFLVLSLCSTDEGYQRRLGIIVKALKDLGNPAKWGQPREDQKAGTPEDTEQLLEIIRQKRQDYKDATGL
ncbi:ATP-dependent DNA helicase [Pluteus cervinus]|uniref:ATP-dependent DNA helicase n=1 Tax=Pluteus cervinus TaxID=181527 RepID=A0ACD3AAZ2_9AGAR|nr:ATP-dependent DNA helicase [Pluteus cervinus]